jgi:hypothetical protein
MANFPVKLESDTFWSLLIPTLCSLYFGLTWHFEASQSSSKKHQFDGMWGINRFKFKTYMCIQSVLGKGMIL